MLPLLLAGLMAGLGLLFFSSTCGDDANITWYASYALAHFGELEGYDGDRVEQSSSLMHVAVIAGLHKLTGIGIPNLAVLLSLLFAGLCVAASMRLAALLSDHPKAGLWAGVFTATCYPLAYWSVSGLDTSLAAWAFTLTLICAGHFLLRGKGLGWAAVFTVVYLCTRPEGGLVWLTALGLVFLFASRFPQPSQMRRRILLLGLVAGMTLMSLVLFRYFYFGRLFPEPVYIKAAGLNFYKLKRGIKYLLRNLAVPSQAAWLLL